MASEHESAEDFERALKITGHWPVPPPVGAQIVYGNHQLRDVTGFYRNSLGDWMLRTRYFNGEVAEDVRLVDVTVLER